MKTNAIAHATAHKPTITVKTVMILDTGDGAFIDDSVKTKPHRTDARKLVLKCTSPERLLAALTAMGVAPLEVLKGRKHAIAVVWKKEAMTALAGVGGPALATNNVPALNGKV